MHPYRSITRDLLSAFPPSARLRSVHKYFGTAPELTKWMNKTHPSFFFDDHVSHFYLCTIAFIRHMAGQASQPLAPETVNWDFSVGNTKNETLAPGTRHSTPHLQCVLHCVHGLRHFIVREVIRCTEHEHTTYMQRLKKKGCIHHIFFNTDHCYNRQPAQCSLSLASVFCLGVFLTVAVYT